jgi:hypothetical protein
MIRFLKERLSMALALNDHGDNNWIRHVSSILDDYNSRLIKGTTFKRKDVRKADYMKLIGQLFRSPEDPTMLFNLSSSSSRGYPDWMSKKIWRYGINSKVYLSADANYTLKKQAFGKKSVTGAYGKKVYTITDRVLKSSGRFFVSLCYRLQGLESLYYESELIPSYAN